MKPISYREKRHPFFLGLATLLFLSAFSFTANAAAPVDISVHGFVSASFFFQDQTFAFGNGQNAEWPLPSPSSSNNLSGFDIRNTRLWLNISGPKLSNGWGTGGHFEGDFFGGFNGSGAFSAQQETPRLRQAFFTLTSPDGSSKVTIGQQWDLVFPIKSVPTSLTHVAFPLAFGNGMIGWRFPGVVWSKDFSQHNAPGAHWSFDLGAFTGSWAGPGSNTNFETAANVDFRPQIEARLNVSNGDWLGYVVGHYSSEDLSGVSGNAPTPIASTITSWAVEFGTYWHPGPWRLKAAVYDGKALGQVFGAITQFGDINEFGGYVQGGFQFTPHWAAYALYATARPNEGDVIAWMGSGSSGRLKNEQFAADLIYTDGPYGIGFEWMHDNVTTTTTGLDRTTTVGNQASVSAIYHF